MIDTHCHIIPGIDDGARDMDAALALLAMAEADGTTRMVLTPHIQFGRFDNTHADIQHRLIALQQAAHEAGIGIELRAAAEVRLDSEILSLVAQKTLPFYGEHDGQHFMLLELPHNSIPPGSDALVKYLRSNNITPVIAHPERNRALLERPNLIQQFVRLGCWFQVTAGSITGQFGRDSKALAEQYLQQGIINIIASDCHNTDYRPPILSNAYQAVVDLLGVEAAQTLFIDNPHKITASMFE